MTKKFRFMVRLLAVVLAVAMLSSAVYIAVKADHDCSGDDCAICRQISICENLRTKAFGPLRKFCSPDHCLNFRNTTLRITVVGQVFGRQITRAFLVVYRREKEACVMKKCRRF